MGFCDELREVSLEIWEAEKTHPFVTGLGDGSLPDEKFRFYLEQDYLFLIEYAKVFALAVPKAGDLETMAYFGQLCSDTLNGEMELHRSYCAEFGLTPAKLAAANPSRTTEGYTGHLLEVAEAGDIVEIVAAVLPCQWGYAEIARHLQARGLPGEPRYRKWIEMYASKAFEAYGVWLRVLLERQAAALNKQRRQGLKDIFLASSQWEHRFWEMAWRMDMGEIANL